MKIPYLGRMVREATIATFWFARDRARFNKLPTHHPARLHVAIEPDHLDMNAARILLECGVNPDYTTNDFKYFLPYAGKTAACQCAQYDKLAEMLSLRLDYGADIERVEVSESGWTSCKTTLLGSAAYYGCIDTAGVLIARGADVNACKAPCPPLVSTLVEDATKRIEMFRLLIDNGADVNRSGIWERISVECDNTPLSLASALKWKRKAIVKLLKSAGAVQ